MFATFIYCISCLLFFFFNDTATTEIYTLSLHDALLIFARRPANPLGWLIGAAGLAGVMAYFCYQYAVFTLLTQPGALPFGDAAAWLYNGVWGLPIFFYPLFIILFPTGKAPSRGWRWVVWFDCALIAWITLLLPVGAGSMQGIDLLEAAAYPDWV